MKITIQIASLVALLIGISACCSKKGSCPILEFQQIEFVNFETNEVKDSIGFVTYKAGSGFTQIVDSQTLTSSRADNSNKSTLDIGAVSADYDYAIYVLKMGKVYRVNNYRTQKIACGKCFMRSNNQFGYELTSYSVNNKSRVYEGNLTIVK